MTRIKLHVPATSQNGSTYVDYVDYDPLVNERCKQRNREQLELMFVIYCSRPNPV